MKILLWADESGFQTFTEAVGTHELVGLVVASDREYRLNEAKAKAREMNIPVYVHPHKNQPEYVFFMDTIKRLKADLFLICSYSMILDEEIFTLPPKGTVNIHGGPLPEYRGANVLNWVLINGEIETALTIHYAQKRVDAGDIIVRQNIPISFTDTAVTLSRKIGKKIQSVLPDVLKEIEAGTHARIPQDERLARTWKRRKPEDGLIDWEWPAERIYNLVRALVKPWPGAYYFDEDGGKVVLDSFLSLSNVKSMQESILKKRKTK